MPSGEATITTTKNQNYGWITTDYLLDKVSK